MMLEQMDICKQKTRKRKKWTWPKPHILYKNYIKMHFRLKHKIQIIKCKTIKLKQRRKSVWARACGKIHRFDTKNMISKINKLDFIETKTFCSVNNLVKGMKRHAVDWQKILANHICDKCFISKSHKEFPKLKWAKRLKSFTKEDLQIAEKHMGRLFNITRHEGNNKFKTEWVTTTHPSEQPK